MVWYLLTKPRLGNGPPVHLVVDSTGLKILGEGVFRAAIDQ